MRILFLTDNFPPEVNAPATRTFENCKEWVKKGHSVTVITCFPNFPTGRVYEGYKNKLYQKDEIEGIKVIRVWSYISSNKGFLKRVLDYISFAVTAFIAGLFIKTDKIIATSPQFFVAISGYMLSIFKRRKWIMEVRDLWPESIMAVDAMKKSKPLEWLEKVELHLYKKAWKIIVVTDSISNSIIRRGTNKEKIYTIRNGANLDIFSPREKSSQLQDNLNLRGSCVVGYIGTHGMAHGLDFILNSIKKLEDDNFHFLFIGDGAEKQNLKKIAHDLQVKNVTFLDSIKKTEVNEYLSIIDIALVPLKKLKVFDGAIPSKIFESVATQTPILLGVNGEAREIIENYKAGMFFEPENEDSFIKNLKILSSNIPSGYYNEGCLTLAKDFNRKSLAIRMLDIIVEEND